MDVRTMNEMLQMKCLLHTTINVITSKPAEHWNVPSQVYAARMRAKLIQSKPTPPSRRDVFDKQKQALLSELSSVLPNVEATQSYEDTPELFDSADLDLLEDDEDQEDSLPEVLESNLEFINAITLLQTRTSAHAGIPSNKYREMLSQFPVGKTSSSQTDSGFISTLESSPLSSSSFIATRDVEHIMWKPQTDEVITQAVDAVLHSVSQDMEDAIADWEIDRNEGSKTKHSLHTVVKLVDSMCKTNEDSKCRGTCVAYVKVLIEHVCSSTCSDDSNLQRRRCRIVEELSLSRYICVDTINILVEIVSHVVANVKAKSVSYVRQSNPKPFVTFRELSRMNHNSQLDTGLRSSEKASLFLVYHLLERLLGFHRNFKVTTSKPPHNAREKITELWMNSVAVPLSVDVTYERAWLSVLEDASLAWMEHFQSILFVNEQCKNIVKVIIGSQ